eukprot:2077266-Prorocentrum_lima.AAC.1
MQATMGYQPALLPDAGRGEAYCDDSVDEGVSRYGHRLREIAVQSMVAAIAADRARRALSSKTRPSVHLVNYEIGDQ